MTEFANKQMSFLTDFISHFKKHSCDNTERKINCKTLC